jgi:hypothetical protein
MQREKRRLKHRFEAGLDNVSELEHQLRFPKLGLVLTYGASPANLDPPKSPEWCRECGDDIWNDLAGHHGLGRIFRN